MRGITILVTILLLSSFVNAQKTDSWTIHHNRKEVGAFKLKDGADENRLVLLNRALDEPGFVIITYKASGDQAGWSRHFVITDSVGKELKKFDNTSELRIHNSDLSRLLESRDRVLVYSWAVPTDPAQAATVRVRRILLCTIYTR